MKYASPSPLPADSRRKISESLDAVLADGLDLHSQIKEAHWNIKGPHFAALHPLFETYATELAANNDEVAERAVTLGGIVHGTSRQIAKRSRLPDYPAELTRDLDHVRELSQRFGKYLEGVRAARTVATEADDADTEGLLTNIVTAFEKHAWFLSATLAE